MKKHNETVDCPPANTGYACDYARHKREEPCGICPLKGKNLTDDECTALRMSSGRRVECCGAFWDSVNLRECPRCSSSLKSQRKAAGTADEKLDGQAENAETMPPRIG
jgi:hypothetical protein